MFLNSINNNFCLQIILLFIAKNTFFDQIRIMSPGNELA